MLTSLEIQNVRIFRRGPWKIPLSPLTVFCGTNGAGKSTLLKLIPLLRQTMGIRESVGATEATMQLVGSQVDLGDYASFVSDGQLSDDITISLSIQDEMPKAMLDDLLPLSKPKRNNTRKKAPIKSDRITYDYCATFTFSLFPHMNNDGLHGALPQKPLVESESVLNPTRSRLKTANFKITVDAQDLLEWSVFCRAVDHPDARQKGISRSEYLLSIPSDYFKRSHAADVMVPDSTVGKNVCVTVGMRGILPATMIAKWRPPRTATRNADGEKWRLFQIPRQMEVANLDLQSALANCVYLAPLRSPAKRFYITNLDFGSRIDPSGEFLPYVLKDQGSNPLVLNRKGPMAIDSIKEPLFSALNYWLYFLRTGQDPPHGPRPVEINVATTRDVLVEIRVTGPQGGNSHALADSGFGYSQVLPILVSVLLADKGQTVIVEQPELHLNPALQVRLGEFFVAMAKSGKQLLIETHSEHIVNSLRVLTAEDESGQLSKLCKLFFLDTESGKPIVRDMDVQPDGSVPKWPRHFFGEAASLTGRLLRAQRRFRSKSEE